MCAQFLFRDYDAGVIRRLDTYRDFFTRTDRRQHPVILGDVSDATRLEAKSRGTERDGNEEMTDEPDHWKPPKKWQGEKQMIDGREIAGVSVISSDLNTRTGAGTMSLSERTNNRIGDSMKNDGSAICQMFVVR